MWSTIIIAYRDPSLLRFYLHGNKKYMKIIDTLEVTVTCLIYGYFDWSFVFTQRQTLHGQ